jgi:hypothetical protein
MSRLRIDLRVLVALALISFTVLGCAAVRGRRGEPERMGFLGNYDQLEPREGYEAGLIYINPNADWTRYKAVQLDSVTLWADKETVNISQKDQQMLTDVAYKALHDKLGEQFKLVDKPGPDVLRVRAALTQAKGARIAMRTISTFVPQAFVVSTVTGLAADVAATVGTATIEMEAVDSVTNERLAAAVDERAGTKTPFTTRTFQKWGDVKAACEWWAERSAKFLVERGVQRKAGAKELS